MSDKFILNTVFKHETKPIDEQSMRDYLAFIKEELDPESEFWLESECYFQNSYPFEYNVSSCGFESCAFISMRFQTRAFSDPWVFSSRPADRSQKLLLVINRLLIPEPVSI